MAAKDIAGLLQGERYSHPEADTAWLKAYAPLGANNTRLGDGRIVENEVLANIANARGKTTAQVALRWVYEQGVSIAPKSFNKERTKLYLDIFDWALTPDDLEKISKIPQRKGVRLANIWGPHDLRYFGAGC